MKKQLLILLIATLSFNCYSQVSFDKGYYINNSDQKIDCFIKNEDWNYNPTEIEYKLTENSEEKKATIRTVKEFGVYNISKFIGTEVKIDRSSENRNKLSYDKKAILNEEKLFLKVLVEGQANLYEYTDANLTRYFYNKKDSIIEQLIYKSYKHSQDVIGKNNKYKQQLWNNLKCKTLTINDAEKLEYTNGDLTRFFVAYNECNNQDYVNYEAKQKKDLFNLTIRPGLNYSTLSLNNNITNYKDVDFGSELGFRFGIEAEFIMPFNKNKWSLLIEPTYQYFKSEQVIESGNVKIDYKSIELPLGIRHYFFLNENSKIFINGSFLLDFSLNSTIEYTTVVNLDIETGVNLAFGLGYKFNDRYSMELRYLTNRNILSSYLYWGSDYNTFSVILGYSFF